MKLNLTEKGKLFVAQQIEEDLSRRGRTSKSKGANFERSIAKKFKNAYGENFIRTPQSGGFAKQYSKADQYRGDIVPADNNVTCKLHIECKTQKSWSLPAWLRQAEIDAPEGACPCVIAHLRNTTKDYIMLDLDDFVKIVPKKSIITKEVTP